jgi:quercetin dioxygenase-like cupin family protein
VGGRIRCPTIEYVRPGTVHVLDETGETSEVLASPAETGDRYRVRLRFAKRAKGPARHLHPGLVEAFTVRSGTIGFQLGPMTSTLRANDDREVPPDTVHAFWNASDEPAEIDVDLIFTPPGPRPHADLAWFGERYATLVDGGRRPGLLELAVLMDRYDEAFALPVPRALRRAIVRPLAFIGRARGHCLAGDPP